MQRPRVPITDLLHDQTTATAVLTSGIRELDDLLGGFKTGEFVVFHGSRWCHSLLERLCVRSLFSKEEGGLDSSVILIDGRNIFDPYFISKTAYLYGMKPEKALNNIWISRAFTSYQMIALVTENLSTFLDRAESRIVIVSDVAALFCDSDIGTSEAIRTFNRVVLFLWKIAREQDIILITSSLRSSSNRKRRLEEYLFGRADVSVGFEDTDSNLKIDLEKHPSRASVSIKINIRSKSVQSLLEF